MINKLNVIFLFAVFSASNCQLTNNQNCSDKDNFDIELESFFIERSISFNKKNINYVNLENPNLKSRKVLKIDISLKDSTNNEGLLHYFLELISLEIQTHARCSDEILITLPSYCHDNGFLFEPTPNSKLKPDKAFDNFLSFCVKNKYSLILNSLDEFVSEFNNSLIEKDKINFKNGFCGLVKVYLNSEENSKFDRFFKGLSVMLVFSKPNNYTKSVIDKVLELNGKDSNNWAEIEANLNL